MRQARLIGVLALMTLAGCSGGSGGGGVEAAAKQALENRLNRWMAGDSDASVLGNFFDTPLGYQISSPVVDTNVLEGSYNNNGQGGVSLVFPVRMQFEKKGSSPTENMIRFRVYRQKSEEPWTVAEAL